MAALPQYKKEFLQASLDGGALRVGSFTLKSGRISPYFFSTGEFYAGGLLESLATAYAHAIMEAADPAVADGWDVLFGPAYKGIPLATATMLRLAQLAPDRFRNRAYSFDRKEAKDHGEGGTIVGAPLRGRKVLIIDDVISAGVAKREAIDKIRAQGGEVVGIVVAVDRQEMLVSPEGDGKPMPSAIGELRKEYKIPIVAIVALDDIIDGLKDFATPEQVKEIEVYREKYGARD